jgi:hypothetical protein
VSHPWLVQRHYSRTETAVPLECIVVASVKSRQVQKSIGPWIHEIWIA